MSALGCFQHELRAKETGEDNMEIYSRKVEKHTWERKH